MNKKIYVDVTEVCEDWGIGLFNWSYFASTSFIKNRSILEAMTKKSPETVLFHTRPQGLKILDF